MNWKPYAAACAVIAALLYLAGSFAYASFDIRIWDEVGRGMVAWAWPIACFFICALIAQERAQ